MLVQAEPELADHETSVSGWLDHSRNLASRYQWTQRNPPPLFDERRDEALLLSLLVTPRPDHQIEEAIAAVHRAREFTLADDARWFPEREMLAIQEAALLERSAGAERALESLNIEGPLPSQILWLKRSELLDRLKRPGEAAEARAAAQTLPVSRSAAAFQAGMDHIRDNDFQTASADFDVVLALDPAHFTARLFQALCFLKLNRPAEAHVALTACIAQRPGFPWNHFYLAQAQIALGQQEQAADSLKHAADVRPKSLAAELALTQLSMLQETDMRRSFGDSKSPVNDVERNSLTH